MKTRCRRRAIDSRSTAVSRCPIRDRDGSPMAFMAIAPSRTLGPAPGALAQCSAVSRRRRCAMRLFTNCTSAPLRPRALTPARSRNCRTWCGSGITHLELMPVATFPGRHGWGYDGVDLYAPFCRLRFAARTCIRSSAPATRAVSASCSTWSTTIWGRTAIIWADTARISPIATTPPGARRSTTMARYSDAVRRFVIDNALMWLRDYGFDGLRLDAVHAIFSFERNPCSRRAGGRGEEARRGARPQFRADCRKRSERSAAGAVRIAAAATGSTRIGRTISITPCTGISRAKRTATTRISTASTDVATALRDGYVYQGQYSAHRRPPAWQAAARSAAATNSW